MRSYQPTAESRVVRLRKKGQKKNETDKTTIIGHDRTMGNENNMVCQERLKVIYI